jgi:hypothetical protein
MKASVRLVKMVNREDEFFITTNPTSVNVSAANPTNANSPTRIAVTRVSTGQYPCNASMHGFHGQHLPGKEPSMAYSSLVRIAGVDRAGVSFPKVLYLARLENEKAKISNQGGPEFRQGVQRFS